MTSERLPIDDDLFVEINNAILDLQRADFQTYERPLKKLARAVSHPALAGVNEELMSGVDFDAFVAEGAASGGSMVGSQKLSWPEETEKELGLALCLILRCGENPDWAVSFAHTYFYAGSKIVAGIRSMTSQVFVAFGRDYKAYVMKKVGAPALRPAVGNARKVFVVHGHDEASRETIARFLERIGFEAVILHEQANRGMTIPEKLVAYGDVGFAVVLLTPDDVGRSAKEEHLTPRARQNVLLELGYFIGRLGRERVCALKKGELEIPSDYVGVAYTELDQPGAWKMVLAKELQAAGHKIDWNVIMS